MTIVGSRLGRNGKPLWGWAGVASALANPERTLGLVGDGYSPEPGVAATGLLGWPAPGPVGDRRLRPPGGPPPRAVPPRRCELRGVRLRLAAVVFVQRRGCWPSGSVRWLRPSAHPPRCQVGVHLSLDGRPDRPALHRCAWGWGTDQPRHHDRHSVPGRSQGAGVLSRGWPPWLPVIRSGFRRLARTVPSFYELLPRYRAIIDGAERRPLRADDIDDVEPVLFEPPNASTPLSTAPAPGPTGARWWWGRSNLRRSSRNDGTDESDSSTAGCEASNVVDRRADGTVPRQSVTPPEWHDDGAAMPCSQTHVALPNSEALFRVLYNVLSSTPREDQGDERAKLTIRVARPNRGRPGGGGPVRGGRRLMQMCHFSCASMPSLGFGRQWIWVPSCVASALRVFRRECSGET